MIQSDKTGLVRIHPAISSQTICSFSHKGRVLRLQPVAARPAAIAAAGPLRHDPFEALSQALTNTSAPSAAIASLNTMVAVGGR